MQHVFSTFARRRVPWARRERGRAQRGRGAPGDHRKGFGHVCGGRLDARVDVPVANASTARTIARRARLDAPTEACSGAGGRKAQRPTDRKADASCPSVKAIPCTGVRMRFARLCKRARTRGEIDERRFKPLKDRPDAQRPVGAGGRRILSGHRRASLTSVACRTVTRMPCEQRAPCTIDTAHSV